MTPTPSFRILIVDDNVDVAEPLAMLLEIEGHQPRFAIDPMVALEIASEFEPDIAILDIGLPGIDGYELAARLRAQPANARCRLIALSGHGPEADSQRGRAAGFDLHLLKPVDIETLLRAIGKLLR